MSASKNYLVVMAGGSGTRFWPKSTSRKPKQFLSFGGGETLIGQTLSRFDGIVPPLAAHRLIVTTELLSDAAQAAVGTRAEIMAEPQGRNTAPCVYWAARVVHDRNPNGVMLVMPSDHLIPNLPSFQRTVNAAIEWAIQNDDLVTLGVRPTRAETGYGYLHLGDRLSDACLKLKTFVEKPNLARAEEFVKSGQYLWNGGMFVWRASTVLKAFDEFMPELKAAYEAAHGNITAAYPKMTATSVDYGIMEKAKNVVTFDLDCGWDDLGSWTSLETLGESLGAVRDGGVCTAGEMLSVESSGCVVDAPDSLVAVLGVKDLIIARNGEAILVAHKSRAQDIKAVVEAVKKARPDLA